MTSRKLIKWCAILGVAVGIPLGLGGATFLYADGLSYMGNAPETCANCHVMQTHLDAWQKGSHHGVAVCNDCHTPHDFFGKYTTKALNGFHHSLAFTTGNYPDKIRIKKRNREIADQNCRRCHEDMIQGITEGHTLGSFLTCLQCHESVGHAD
jgi:cytochrome c nitrite reductase small subunit